MNERCTATRRDGSPCRANALPGKAVCWAHDEALKPKAAEARRRGGANRSNTARAQKRMPRELRDIVQIVEAAMGGVLQSKITPPQGQALASLVGAWVKLRETGELQAQLDELKASIEGGNQWRA